MRNRKDRPADEADKFGFRWGPLDVIRIMEFQGSRCLEVSSDSGSVDVYVSKAGRSIRVFKDGKEMKVIS